MENMENMEKTCIDKTQLEFCYCDICEQKIEDIYNTTKFTDADIIQLRHIYKEYRLTLPRLISYLEHENTVLVSKLKLLPRFFSYFTTKNTDTLSFTDFVNALAILLGTSKKISSTRFFFDICAINERITEESISNVFNQKDEASVYLCKLITSYNKKWDNENKGYTVWEDVAKGFEKMNPENSKIILIPFKGYRLIHTRYKYK